MLVVGLFYEEGKQMNIWTWPNALTTVRLIIAFWFAYLISFSTYGYWVGFWALGGFCVGSVTDYLDGWIAKMYPEQRSWIGSVLDPIADKLLVATYAIYLWSVGIADGWFEAACFALIIFREGAVMLLRFVRGPDAVPVSWYGKWKTAFQMATLVCYGLFPVLPDLRDTLAPVLLLIAVALTYWSWVRYLTPEGGAVKA